MTTTLVPLQKYHGLGNDFLVALDGARWLSEGAGIARAACNRHTGVGADGLLLVLPGETDSAGSDLRMKLHNADGSVAEMSGNGIRCFVQAAVDAKLVSAGHVRVATDAGLRTVEATSSDGNGRAEIAVDMGMVIRDIHPVLGDPPGEAMSIDVGNPHLVIATAERAIAEWGPKLEAPYLVGPTRGINVELVSQRAPGVVDMRVWERGVGVTNACGTGATATAVAAASWGWDVDGRVKVHQPGGSADVVLRGDCATLIGPSQRIASVEFLFVAASNATN